MKFMLDAIFLLMMGLMCLCIRQTGKTEGRLAKAVSLFLCMVLALLMVNGAAVLSTNYFVASVAINAYYACIDWTLICMLHYIGEYTQVFRDSPAAKGIVYVAAAADTLMMVCNVFLGFLFQVESVTVGGEIFYVAAGYRRPFAFHLAVAYLLTLFGIAALVVKAAKTPRFYRVQYLVVLGLFMLTFGTSIVNWHLKSFVDPAVFFYVIMSAAICYFSLFYVSKGLIERTMTFAINDMSEMVFCFDLWGKCVFVNKRVAADFQYIDIREAAEREFKPWFESHREDQRDNFQWVEKRLVDHRVRHLENVYHKLTDSRNERIGYFFVVTDRTEEMETFRKEHYRMSHDELTGLYNRAYFYEQVENTVRQNRNKKYYLMCTNISGFKIYNQLFGEASGDDVLLTQAELLRKTTGIAEIYGRLSGDEFGLLIPEENFSEEAINRHTQTMQNEFSNSLYRMHIYAGVYVINDREESAAQMCSKAKMAIDSIKDEYDTFFAYFDEQLLEKTLYERRLVGELEKALEEEQFCIFLQPQVRTDGTVAGAEALVRWQHPEKGWILPGDFVSVFEHTGLLWKVDKYVWEEAARRLKIWQSAQKEDWHISVNISPGDFYHLDIYETFTGLVEKYRIEPRSLKLEITESMFMKEVKNKLKVLQKLRDYGFEVEIDNFGNGYSSLNILKDIHLDVLKMDMSFLRGSRQPERSWAIIQTIVDLARDLDMRVVTEGVETEEQVERLKAFGCELYQGYYFAKPMPVDEFEDRYM
ncbi:MAG: EAL domain-containing protein [Blautia sp.]|nr:EAL domain-containing protein [Blautia sp.]